MTSPTDRILAALYRLCAAADVAPDDASPEAATKVRDLLRVALAGRDVFHCALNHWIRQHAEVPTALVTHDRVFVPTPACERVKGAEGIPGTHVLLPVAVRGAVRLFDRGDVMPARRARVTVVCPGCKRSRRVGRSYAAKGAAVRQCRTCANKREAA